ncbi:MAG: DUF2723 domain-containing protein, partial [Deltaproteobacteria bacterium]
VCGHGVAHPPGYPLYHLLGGAWCALPWGSWGLRLNVLSALCTLAAALVTFAALWRHTRQPAAALLGALLFGLSPLCWRYAVTTEVFALNHLLASLLLWAVIDVERAPRRAACLTATVLGLGVCHHHTLLLFAGPAMLYVLRRGGLRAGVGRLLGCLVLGLSPCVYLLWAGAHASPLDWGDTAHWEGFVDHLLRRQYGTFRLARRGDGSGAWAFLSAYGRCALGELCGVGVPLAAVAAVVACRSPSRQGGPVRLLWLGVLTYLLVFAVQANLSVDDPLTRDVLARFFMLPNLLLAAAAAVGAAGLLQRSTRTPPLALPLVMGWSLLWAVYQAPAQSLRGLTLYRDFGAAFVRAAPPGAIILVTGDLQLHALRYVTEAEGLRPDVRLIDWGHLRTPWGRRRAQARYPDLRFPPPTQRGLSLGDFLDANLPRLPLLLAYDETSDSSWRQHYTMWPLGMLRLPLRLGAPLAADTLVARSRAALPHLAFAPLPPGQIDPWRAYLEEQVWRSYSYTGHYMLNVAANNAAPGLFVQASIAALQTLTQSYVRAPAQDFKALGEAYAQSLGYAPNNAAKMDQAWRAYLDRAAPNDQEAPRVRARLQGSHAWRH